MVRDTVNINDLMTTIRFGNLPDVIEIETELPELLITNLMLGSVKRWIEISEYFKRPVRLYAICDNPSVEKHMINLVNCQDNLFITIIPAHRKEMLKFD